MTEACLIITIAILAFATALLAMVSQIYARKGSCSYAPHEESCEIYEGVSFGASTSFVFTAFITAILAYKYKCKYSCSN